MDSQIVQNCNLDQVIRRAGDQDDVWNAVIEASHPFEAELSLLVVANLRLTLDAIDELEKRESLRMREFLGNEDHDLLASQINWLENTHEEMRKAARHLALVGVVTRLQHWIKTLADLNGVAPKAGGKDSELCKFLRGLNESLSKDPPIAMAFIQDLVTARDSVIHGDSKSQWEHNVMRSVADHHREGGELRITQHDLENAIQKAVQLGL